MGGEIKYDKHWKILAIIFFILFAVLFIFSIYLFLVSNNKSSDNFSIINYSNQNNRKVVQEKKCTDCIRGAIDGVYTKPENANLYPFAIVIDNSLDARPAFGLSKAKLVYEVETEGGITRYLAIFDDISGIKKIGPVRSARPYFVDWTKELSATLVHCGGSPSALVQIIKKDVNDLNEFYNETYFYRDNKIKAPHNVFISKNKLESYLDKNNLKNGKVLSFKFKDDNKKTDQLGLQGIKINYKKGYNIKWEYNEVGNNYVRYLNDIKHIDGDNNQIVANNIITQFVDGVVIDDKLRIKLDTIGEGDAILCLDGECLKGKWKKDKLESRTRYYIDNNEVEFNAGITWIEVVRNNFKKDVIY